MSDLRERLIAAPGFGAYWADRVLPIVAAWLRDQADLITDNYPDEEDIFVAAWISQLADAIDPQPERTTP